MAQTRDGGKPNVKPLPYSPPKGPTSQYQEGPGLHGTNYGACGTQARGHQSGSPDLHGSNHGNKGTQR